MREIQIFSPPDWWDEDEVTLLAPDANSFRRVFTATVAISTSRMRIAMRAIHGDGIQLLYRNESGYGEKYPVVAIGRSERVNGRNLCNMYLIVDDED